MRDSRHSDALEAVAKHGAASGAALFQRGGVTRRTFLEGAAFIGVCGSAMGFGLAGCASPSAESGAKGATQGWKAGTYTASVTGHNAPFTIDVTFSESAVTAIDTATSQESLGVGASALETLSNQIIEHQTLDIDSVTGATLSSMCLQQGVRDCAEQAGAADALEADRTTAWRRPTMPTCASSEPAARGLRRPSPPPKRAPRWSWWRNAASRAARRTSRKERSTRWIPSASKSRASRTPSSSSTRPPTKAATSRARPSSSITSPTTPSTRSTGSNRSAWSSKRRWDRPPVRSASAATTPPHRQATPTSAPSRRSSKSTPTRSPSCTRRRPKSLSLTAARWPA